MLKLINTKILLAILAALSALGGAVAYQRHETEKAAAAAAKAAAILEQQQKDAEEQRERDEAFRQQVETRQEAAQFRRSQRRQDLAELRSLSIIERGTAKWFP